MKAFAVGFQATDFTTFYSYKSRTHRPTQSQRHGMQHLGCDYKDCQNCLPHLQLFVVFIICLVAIWDLKIVFFLGFS